MKMEGTQNIDTQYANMQGLLDRYLTAGEPGRAAPDSGHLDDDSLAAFVDGGLTERESVPVVSHLSACSLCRHITADLVRLDTAFTDNEAVTIEPAAKSPTKVSEVLSGILAKILSTGDAAVFAHSEEDVGDDKVKDEAERDEKN